MLLFLCDLKTTTGNLWTRAPMKDGIQRQREGQGKFDVAPRSVVNCSDSIRL